jgi:hypothetical protein
MLNWGEGFDVNGEFSGIVSKFNEGQRRQQLQSLEATGLKTEHEREQYRFLQDQMRSRKS